MALLAAVTVSLRLACVAAIEVEPVSDFLSYLTMASNLYDDKGLVDDYGTYAGFSSGYAYFLYGVFLIAGKSLWAAKLANVALGLVSVLLLYRLGKLVI